MEFIFLSYLPAIVGLCALALVTYLNNPKARINRLFTLFTALIALWQTLLLMTDTATTEGAALWSLRAALFTSAAASFSFLLLSDSFPIEKLRSLRRRVVAGIAMLTACFMVLSLTPLIAANVRHSASGTTLEMTPLYGLHTLFLVGNLLSGVVLVARRKKVTTIRQRAQIKLFVFGITAATAIALVPGFIFIALGIENVLMALLTSMSFLVFSVFMWFAITRYQMFHIRSVVARAVAYIVSVLVVALFYVGFTGLIVESLTSSRGMELVVSAASAALAIVIFNGIKEHLHRVTSRLFYREGYSSREKLDVLTGELVSKYDLGELISGGMCVMESALKPRFLSFVVMRPTKSQTFGWNVPSEVTRFIRDAVDAHTNYVQADDFGDDNPLRKHGIELVVLVRSGANTEGYLVFGARSSGDVYTKKDLEFLSIAARNIGLAVNNAQSYKRIRDFNKTLRAKITQATKELLQKNQELERLHKTKDDFISMASHQLRPKITASAGFLELINRSNEPLSAEQHELLGLAQKGMSQMTEIITNMLDISRMDFQEIELHKAKTNGLELVEQEITSVNRAYKGSRISLHSSIDSDNAHWNIDRVKIREVLQILLSNAADYSKGAIEVHTKSAPNDMVQIAVVDNGIGMTVEERSRLFEKFYRSNEAKRLRPTGSGIGLYAARLIVEAHGGKMIVKSKKGVGSEVGFQIPY